MRSLLTICLTLLLMAVGNAQNAKPNSFTAVVKNQKDSTVIPGVFIQKVGTYNAQYSRANGDFTMNVGVGDTLLLHSLGYHTYIFYVDTVLPNDTLEIYMYPDVTKIAGITIEIVKGNEIQYYDKKTRKRITLDEVINTLEHPITAFYRNFTFRGREPQRRAARMAYYKVMDRFNYEMVYDATKQQNDSILSDFMEYCAFNYADIKSMTQIELYMKTLDCYKEYKVEVLKKEE